MLLPGAAAGAEQGIGAAALPCLPLNPHSIQFLTSCPLKLLPAEQPMGTVDGESGAAAADAAAAQRQLLLPEGATPASPGASPTAMAAPMGQMLLPAAFLGPAAPGGLNLALMMDSAGGGFVAGSAVPGAAAAGVAAAAGAAVRGAAGAGTGAGAGRGQGRQGDTDQDPEEVLIGGTTPRHPSESEPDEVGPLFAQQAQQSQRATPSS